MKYLLLTLCVISFGFTFAQSGKERSKKSSALEGTITGGEGQYLYLIETGVRKQSVLDSALIGKNGDFGFQNFRTGKVDYYSIVLNGEAVMLITDSTERVNFKSDTSSFQTNAVWKGSPQSAVLQELVKEIEPLASEQKILMAEANNSSLTQEERFNAKKKYNDLASLATETIKSWVTRHEKEPAALIAMLSIQPAQEPEMYRKELLVLEPVVGHTSLFKVASDELKKVDKLNKAGTTGPKAESPVAVGKEVPNIEQLNPEGETMKLSDLRGKIVLIDFWASWCGPCRRENPNVVKAYNTYHEDGFEVFSVSLDSDANRWKQAIQQDGLIWPYHVSDLLGWNSQPAADYGVRSIPFPVLIDREGKVIASGSDVRGPMLEQLLRNAFGH